MKVAIHQPNYIPWLGYFSKINRCDLFVFLDDVQMPIGRSYVYRCQIRSGEVPRWLSIPSRFSPGDPINKVVFAEQNWFIRHMDTLRAVYGKCPYFKEIFSIIEPIYKESGELLGQFNIRIISAIASYLGLTCRFALSSDLHPTGKGDERLISIVKIVGADTYLSGKGGQNYQSPVKFFSAGINLEVLIYKPIEYPQNHEVFLYGLSILDTLFNVGQETKKLLHY